MSIFDKFNKNIDLSSLVKDVEESQKNGANYEQLPEGNYIVEIAKMELKESSNGNPMMSIWFKIIDGQYTNKFLFYNQVLTQGFQIHLANEFLRSLSTDLDIQFIDYNQYNELILDVFEQTSVLEYELIYSVNKKGYPKFEIEEAFDK